MPTAEARTRWDLSNLYSGLEGSDYRRAFEELEGRAANLETLFDSRDIRRQSSPPSDENVASALEEALRLVNEFDRLADTLGAFVYAHVSTDSYDAVAQRELSRLEMLDTRRQKLGVRLAGYIGSREETWASAVDESPVLESHRFFLEHTAEQSRYLMSEELEGLAAELCVDGAGAFGKLQGNITSQLKVPFERDGRTEELPITVVRNLSFDPDPDVRRRAYEAEMAGWHSIRTPVAASLNAVKGTALTLARRRGREDVLQEALVQNRIDRPTLEAMLGAIREAFPLFRRYLKSKAQRLGHERLPWWDLFAPVGAAEESFSWPQARDFIVEKFGSFAPDLAEYAATAFDDRWIDGEPRDGKRGGAFCMGVMGVEESRILANFDGSFDQVSTLAHELGHGYHNHCQRGLAPLRRGAPSTLAETASIFCETLVAEAALREAGDAGRLMILETQLAGATQVCLDISSRFLFERAFLEGRASGELGPEEICRLMLDAQKDTYGDAIQEETFHRYMWLWKPHYYEYAENFYNFPYAFGHLFGLGLYAHWQSEGAAFVPRYRELLRDTALDYAAPLAARFGIDIAAGDFWRQSLQVVARQVEEYERLGG